MRSDRLEIVNDPAGNPTGKPTYSRIGDNPVDQLVRRSRLAVNACSALLVVALITGCSNAQVRRTPVTDLGEAWFCEMNETRDDWDCVQDGDLAQNPQPARLPTDPVEPSPFDEEVPALPVVTAPTEGLANPSAAINFDAIAQATVRPDTVTAILERSPEHFAVQLTAVETQALADGFISNHGLEDMEDLITLELAQEGEMYYVVLYGIYDTFIEAKAQADTLPESLADTQPWVRPLESIQSGIADAESVRLGLND